MLVINRIELVMLDQPQQVWKFQRQNAIGLQQDLEAFRRNRSGREPAPGRCCREPGRRLRPSADQFFGEFGAEESHQRGNAFFDCDFRHVRRRLDSEDGHTAFHKILQQVAVVARDLDRKTVFVETETGDHHARQYLSACLSHESENDEK